MADVIQIQKTDIYEDWIQALRDKAARGRITNRIRRLSEGNFGDAKALGSGIAELRIDYVPATVSISPDMGGRSSCSCAGVTNRGSKQIL